MIFLIKEKKKKIISIIISEPFYICILFWILYVFVNSEIFIYFFSISIKIRDPHVSMLQNHLKAVPFPPLMDKNGSWINENLHEATKHLHRFPLQISKLAESRIITHRRNQSRCLPQRHHLQHLNQRLLSFRRHRRSLRRNTSYERSRNQTRRLYIQFPHLWSCETVIANSRPPTVRRNASLRFISRYAELQHFHVSLLQARETRRRVSDSERGCSPRWAVSTC